MNDLVHEHAAAFALAMLNQSLVENWPKDEVQRRITVIGQIAVGLAVSLVAHLDTARDELRKAGQQ
jgi:hypothetical protein